MPTFQWYNRSDPGLLVNVLGIAAAAYFGSQLMEYNLLWGLAVMVLGFQVADWLKDRMSALQVTRSSNDHGQQSAGGQWYVRSDLALLIRFPLMLAVIFACTPLMEVNPNLGITVATLSLIAATVLGDHLTNFIWSERPLHNGSQPPNNGTN